ncbi:MAG: large subunit ribosomal protein L25 [Myxococcota bacterium]|jgi:large subunit ribosomal protein L25
MDTNMNATVRTNDVGKGAARKLRAAGRLPAVVYAQGAEATAIHIDPLTLTTIFRKTENRNTIIHLEIDGESVPCLVRDAQRHPLTREILHVDFYRLAAGQSVTVDVPLEPTGRPEGASLGGRLRVIRRTVPVRSDWSAIPATLPVDVSPMIIGDFITISQVATPDGVEILFESDFNVLSVYGKKGGDKKTEDEAESAAAAKA